jgi:DNA-3-methyladenine glycosylase I
MASRKTRQVPTWNGPDDGRIRCTWVLGGNQLYHTYHDTEWGVPQRNDRGHFEFLVLEAAQAGLSWSIVLNKREGYRRAFAGFDPERVARFNSRSIARLLLDPSIIRNRLKIEAAVSNARRFLDVREQFGSFDRYVWRFVGGAPIQNRYRRHRQLPETSGESEAQSRDLKDR